MKYLIGIDGGGTKTHCVVTDFNLNKIYECYGGASNFLVHGIEKVSETIFNLILQCKDELKIDINSFAGILIGTAGAGRKSDAEKLENSVKKFALENGISINNFFVESDARISLEGAFSGNEGSILISGTGSIMFGKDAEGNIHRVGGFGRILGDEGSGFSIGKKGLNALAKNFDGRGKDTLLFELILKEFEIDSPEKLITEVYSNNFDIAKIAPLVFKAAENDDDICNRILKDEIDELILHVISMKKKLISSKMKLCLFGGILLKENYFSNLLKEKIHNEFNDVEIQSPDFPPEIGAVILAKQKLSQ